MAGIKTVFHKKVKNNKSKLKLEEDEYKVHEFIYELNQSKPTILFVEISNIFSEFNIEVSTMFLSNLFKKWRYTYQKQKFTGFKRVNVYPTSKRQWIYLVFSQCLTLANGYWDQSFLIPQNVKSEISHWFTVLNQCNGKEISLFPSYDYVLTTDASESGAVTSASDDAVQAKSKKTPRPTEDDDEYLYH
ncbi:hypothetical protein ACTFIW_003377 [Dictyostelium discoideum]